MKTKLAVILLVLTALGGATAQEAEKPAEFVSYESGICKFNIYGYEITTPVERAIVFGVSTILDTYKDTFGFSFPNNLKVKITIIGDYDKFLEYQKAQCGKIISQSGYFSGRHREAVILQKKDSKATKDAKDMVAIIFHEVSHFMLRYNIPWVPEWVNEGLAEYFGGMNVFGENRRVFLQKGSSRWLKRWSKKGFPIELTEYLNLTHDEWMRLREQDSTAAYGIGYSLVYFLMSRAETEVVLKELLWAFKMQATDVDSVKTIDSYYPGGFEKLQRNWKKWMPRARPYRPLRALRTQAEKSKEDPATEIKASENEGQDLQNSR